MDKLIEELRYVWDSMPLVLNSKIIDEYPQLSNIIEDLITEYDEHNTEA